MTYYHHTIEYPDGRIIQGAVDHRSEPALVGIADVTGLRVLDLASNDGFFAFWSEQHGAREVLAIDVDCYENYDWGPLGAPYEAIQGMEQPDKSVVFWEHHRAMASNVRRERMSIYELNRLKHGTFDLIWNYGLLYHLRHPLLALDICRTLCTGAMVLETQILNVSPNLRDRNVVRTCANLTDWFYPSEAAMVAWLRSSGFLRVGIQDVPKDEQVARQRFIAYAGDAPFIHSKMR